LRGAPSVSPPLAVSIPAVLPFVPFLLLVLLSWCLLSPGRSAITAQLQAFAASRLFD
jgi:hypothetical protein